MTCGEKICRLRKAKGITQEELGKVLNVTYQAVSKWERGESLPDFATMSQIAKYFEVPLSYFEDGGEELLQKPAVEPFEPAQPSQPSEPVRQEEIREIGVCSVCGKTIKEGEEHRTVHRARSSRVTLLCKACDEEKRRSEARRYAREQLGSGVDAKLIISLILTVAAYVAFTVLECLFGEGFYALLMFLTPLAVFGLTHVIFEFFADLKSSSSYDFDGYTRNLSLIIAGIIAGVNLICYLVLYFVISEFGGFYLTLLGAGTVVSFTFVSQFMWGNIVKEIFTAGGFTFKLPGIIFSLTPDSIIMMIITKIFLGFIAIIVFLVSTVLVALAAMIFSVLWFVPGIIIKSTKDKKAKSDI